MADSNVTVVLKERCFATFTIGGHQVEIFTDAIAPGGVTLNVRSAKKIGALRVYQELPGMKPAGGGPRLSDVDPLDAIKGKRAG